MPCFTHEGSRTPISKETGATVHLVGAPPADPEYGVAVFIWEPMECTCTKPGTHGGFTHTAKLRVDEPVSFMCERICRGQDAGSEVLYAGMVRVRELMQVTASPSGCEV